MANVVLDDKTGRIEVRIFPDLYERYYGLLEMDSVIICKGEIKFDDFAGGLQMRASEVWDIVKARERVAKGLKLRLEACELGENFTTELAQILTPFKGRPGEGCAISIAYVRAEAQAQVTLGEAWRVVPADDLLQNLRDRYGKERVALDY